MKFEFITDDKSQEYCESIANVMINLFSITDEEAIGRINRYWNGMELIGKYHVLYHEEEDEWAHIIYYGNESKYWTNPPDLKPLPFP